jgi:hypothetical protein
MFFLGRYVARIHCDSIGERLVWLSTKPPHARTVVTMMRFAVAHASVHLTMLDHHPSRLRAWIPQ